MDLVKRYRYLFFLIGALILLVIGSLFGMFPVCLIAYKKFGYSLQFTQKILVLFSNYYSTEILENGQTYAQFASEYFTLNPDYFNAAKHLSALLQLFSYAPLVIFIGVFLWKDLLEDAKKMKSEFGRNMLIVLIGFISMLALSYMVNIIYAIFGDGGTSVNESTLQLMMQSTGKWYLLIAVVIFAPICEEIVFRKLIIDTFEKSFKLNSTIAICVSAFIFAFIHVTDCQSFVYIFQYLALAFPLCLVYHYSNNNIYVSISVHMLNNLLVGIMYLVQYGI